MQAMLGRLAQKLAAISVSDDQTRVFRKDICRYVRRGGEIEPVAMQPVVGPFLVDAEILDRRLDLDDPELAVVAQRHQVGAAAGGERQFADAGMAERDQQALRAARDRKRGRRLAAVDGKLDRLVEKSHSTILRDSPAARSGNARANASRFAASTPRSVIRPVTRRAGVTSNA